MHTVIFFKVIHEDLSKHWGGWMELECPRGVTPVTGHQLDFMAVIAGVWAQCSMQFLSYLEIHSVSILAVKLELHSLMWDIVRSTAKFNLNSVQCVSSKAVSLVRGDLPFLKSILAVSSHFSDLCVFGNLYQVDLLCIIFPLISCILSADRFVFFCHQKFLLNSAARDDGVVLQHHRLKHFWHILFHLRGCMCEQLAVVISDFTYLDGWCSVPSDSDTGFENMGSLRAVFDLLWFGFFFVLNRSLHHSALGPHISQS